MMKEVQFTISEIRSRIFLFQFGNHYDMSMFFLRYQEYYESASPQFRGQSFEILDYMKYWSETYGDGNFTYPLSWAGFNFPAKIVKQVNDLGIIDKNIYDYQMLRAYRECQSKVGDQFYIIGSMNNNIETINHEIAHGYFYLNKQYKNKMTKLVKQLPANFTKQMYRWMIGLGYTEEVLVDEIQAYLSTDLIKQSNMAKQCKITNKKMKEVAKPFQQLFQQYDK